MDTTAVLPEGFSLFIIRCEVRWLDGRPSDAFTAYAFGRNRDEAVKNLVVDMGGEEWHEIECVSIRKPLVVFYPAA